jgi:hypothetical protein
MCVVLCVTLGTEAAADELGGILVRCGSATTLGSAVSGISGLKKPGGMAGVARSRQGCVFCDCGEDVGKLLECGSLVGVERRDRCRCGRVL